jgi:hypothetical protein
MRRQFPTNPLTGFRTVPTTVEIDADGYECVTFTDLDDRAESLLASLVAAHALSPFAARELTVRTAAVARGDGYSCANAQHVRRAHAQLTAEALIPDSEEN